MWDGVYFLAMEFVSGVTVRQVGQALADMAEGGDTAGLTAVVEGDLRFFTFSVGEEQSGSIGELDFPEDTRAVAVTRDGDSRLLRDDMKLEKGDSVLLITDKAHIKELSERFGNDDDDLHGDADDS